MLQVCCWWPTQKCVIIKYIIVQVSYIGSSHLCFRGNLIMLMVQAVVADRLTCVILLVQVSYVDYGNHLCLWCKSLMGDLKLWRKISFRCKSIGHGVLVSYVVGAHQLYWGCKQYVMWRLNRYSSHRSPYSEINFNNYHVPSFFSTWLMPCFRCCFKDLPLIWNFLFFDPGTLQFNFFYRHHYDWIVVSIFVGLWADVISV